MAKMWDGMRATGRGGNGRAAETGGALAVGVGPWGLGGSVYSVASDLTISDLTKRLRRLVNP
jgi:hypothetical protein